MRNFLMKKLVFWVSLCGVFILVEVSTPHGVFASSDEYEMIAKPTHEAWQSECGECHIAYPPSMLSSPSWQAVMEGLDDHFGVDASIDEQTWSEISTFLAQHASRRQSSKDGLPLLRITQTRWFKHEHQEELPQSIRDHPQV